MSNPTPEPVMRSATGADSGRSCPYCRFAIKQGTAIVACGACHAPHHQDCWTDNGGCAIVACDGGPAAGTSQHAPPPTRRHPVAPPPIVPPPPPPAPAPGDGGARSSTVLIVACAVALLAAGGAVAAVLLTRAEPVAQRDPVTVTVSQTSTSDVGETSTVGGPTETTPQLPPPPPPPPPPSPPPPPPPPPPSESPDTVIREHFTRIANGDLQGAYNLFAPSYRNAVPRWVAVRSAAQPRVSIAYVNEATITGNTARVPTKIYLRDTYPSNGSDTKCRRFEGELPLVLVSGHWRYAPTGHDWSGVVLPSTISDCP